MKIRSAFLGLALAACQMPAHAAFSTLGILGDSLSDTGRLFSALSSASFGFFAEPNEPYFPGRFSNGPVWAEYYAASHPGIAIGNAAMGGAFSGVINGRDNAGDDDFNAVPVFGSLLANAATGLNAQLPLVPNVTGQNTAFALWIGANDINNAVSIGFANPEDVVPTSLTNVGNAIDQLLALGAVDVFVGNLPDLGRTPSGVASGNAASLTAATLNFNQGLVSLAAGGGGKVHVVDIFSAFNALLANAAALGFTDTTTPCVDDLFDDSACSDPSSHVFWDGVHPTTGVHALVADVFAAAFEPTPVPLPGAAWLFAPAFGLLTLARRRNAA
jgi:phospholipase/lecithinase/hemolysin